MSNLLEWTPAEWRAFQTEYNRRLKSVLSDEKLFAKFGTVLAEQIAVVEDGGGNPEIVHTVENYRDIIVRGLIWAN